MASDEKKMSKELEEEFLVKLNYVGEVLQELLYVEEDRQKRFTLLEVRFKKMEETTIKREKKLRLQLLEIRKWRDYWVSDPTEMPYLPMAELDVLLGAVA